MPKYNPRVRKGRSSLQKEQLERARMKAYTSRQEPPRAESELPNENPNSDTPRTQSSSAVGKKGVLLKGLRKEVEKLRKNYKNALRREKNAKMKIRSLQDSTSSRCDQLSRLCKEQQSAEIELQQFRLQADASFREVSELQEHVFQLKRQVALSSQELVRSSSDLKNQLQKLSILDARNKHLHRSRDALRKRFQRVRTKLTQSQTSELSVTPNSPQFNLKDRHGVIRPEVRDMLKNLACEGVSTKSVNNIINIIAEGLGMDVLGSVSTRSIARVMLEGLVGARMQLGYELNQAKSISLCGDSTSIKNQSHEARAMYLQFPTHEDISPNDHCPQGSAPTSLRTLGIDKAINHTAQQQLEGWINRINICCDTLARSPLGQSVHIDSKLVAPKLRGVLTDHAADQKRFYELLKQWKRDCDRQVRAVSILKEMTTAEQLKALSDYLDNATHSIKDWRSLPNEQQSAIMHDAWLALALQMGETEFQNLPPGSQFDIDLLAWTGCCMHKELNAVRGGSLAMAAIWKQHKLCPPIPLKNKYEVAKQSNLDEDNYARGAIKFVSLAGALFKNKDDKKGYQHTVDCFFEDRFGYSKRFPDTSNTRYSSYCDAAIELLLHLETYKELMKTLCWAKGTATLNNIESNVYGALDNPATLTELAVLALYAQAVGRPYMRHVRCNINALELGPFHNRVKQHCQNIIERPELLLAPDVEALTGTLDGQPWDQPEVIYWVIRHSSELPNLRTVLVAFFQGALETWGRFTTEFDSGGIIAQSTIQQRHSAWVPPTNDISEGLLGQCRQMLRRAPTMTDAQRNARVMWKQHGTSGWTKHMLTNEDEKFVRQEARKIDSSGENKIMRLAMNAALEERAEANKLRQEKAVAKRIAQKTKLDETKLLEHATYSELFSMRVRELDLQIDKLRAAGDRLIRPKSMIPNKNAKIMEIMAAFERRNRKIGESMHIDIPESHLPAAHSATIDTTEGETCPDDIDLYFHGEEVF